MAGTMRAVVQEGYGSPDVLRLREIERPAVGAADILVRIKAASVNAADYHLVHVPVPVRLLFALRRSRTPIRGFDLAGVVEAVGDAVRMFKPGDEVFGTAPGTFAEYAVTNESRLALKPRRLTFREAAAVPVAGISALQGLRDHGRLQPGQRVMVHGAGGGVGTFAVQIAKALGAHVTAVTSTRNLDVVRGLGPDDVIDYAKEDFTTLGQQYDVFLDVAATRSISDCLSILTPRGAFVRVGAPKGGMGAILAGLIATRVRAPFASQRMLSFLARVRREDLAYLGELVDAGKLTPAIDREYSLSEVPEAIRYTKAGQGRAKVVINVAA